MALFNKLFKKSNKDKPLTTNEITAEREKRKIANKKQNQINRERNIKNAKQKQKELGETWTNIINVEIPKAIKESLNLTAEERAKRLKAVKEYDKQNKLRCIDIYAKSEYMTAEEKKQFKEAIKFNYENKLNKKFIFDSNFNDYLGLWSALDSAYGSMCLYYWNNGIKAKKNGNINLAIECFESVVRLKFEAPASYTELIKIYKEDSANKMRILNEAVANIPDPKTKKNFNNQLLIEEKGGLENVPLSDALLFFDGYDLVKYANKYFSKNKKDIDKLNELTPVLDKAFKTVEKDNHLATVYKLKGELALANNDKDNAIKFFKESLVLKENKTILKKYEKLIAE